MHKIWRDFGQVQTSITNISGTDKEVDKQKMALSTPISPTFDEKNWSTFFH